MIREHKLQSEPHNLKTRCPFVGRERNRESSICGFFSYHLDSLWWLGIFSTTGSLKPNHNILKTTTCVWDYDISWVPKLNLEVKATSRRKWKLSPNSPKLFWDYHHLKKLHQRTDLGRQESTYQENVQALRGPLDHWKNQFQHPYKPHTEFKNYTFLYQDS